MVFLFLTAGESNLLSAKTSKRIQSKKISSFLPKTTNQVFAKLSKQVMSVNWFDIAMPLICATASTAALIGGAVF